MKPLSCILLALVTYVMTFYATSAAESVYRDPQGRFILRVPDRWTTAPTNGGVSIKSGKAWAQVRVFSGIGNSSDLLSFLSEQIKNQSKDFREINSGPCRFGGQQGTCGLYSGVNPRGVATILKIAALVTGGKGYTLMLASPQQEFPLFKADLDQIEQSFSP
jgi:hypothetical protein